MSESAASDDARYVDLLMLPLRACANTRPSLGRADGEGVTLEQFHTLYGTDPLYHWIGLDSDLMYAAHKAAGAMTSVYRQLGFGCEQLVRAIVADRLGLTEEELAWGYDVVGADGKSGRLTLDMRIDIQAVREPNRHAAVEKWLRDAGTLLGLTTRKRSALRGAVFEIRQGYKSADAKRQNADMRSALRARDDGYLFVIILVSSQASQTVIRRYRNASMLVLVGDREHTTSMDNTFAFCNAVLGYSLPAFFERNTATIRSEVERILRGLLSPA